MIAGVSRYAPKPSYVEAIKYAPVRPSEASEPFPLGELRVWTELGYNLRTGIDRVPSGDGFKWVPILELSTDTKTQIARPGDFIVKDALGNLVVMSPAAFALAYETRL